MCASLTLSCQSRVSHLSLQILLVFRVLHTTGAAESAPEKEAGEAREEEQAEAEEKPETEDGAARKQNTGCMVLRRDTGYGDEWFSTVTFYEAFDYEVSD